MNVQYGLAALAAGVTAFVLVGVAVTELAADQIAFSLFLGIPAGLAAGVIATSVVLLTIGDPRPRRRRLGVALGSFGGAFLVGVAGLAFGLRTGAWLAIVGGVVLGVVVAVVAWFV